MKGIVLFGHGARNAEWAEPFHRIRAAILARAPEVPVEMGFLELMRPTFAEAVDGLVARGVTEVAVMPVFMAAGSHVKKDLPLMAAEAMERHPALSISIAPALGESPLVIDAMATYILGAAG